jgi:5-methylcytosine-specific restriction endonuclease McrA
VPGCRHATFVDVHHLRPRAEGGANTIENLVTLCGAPEASPVFLNRKQSELDHLEAVGHFVVEMRTQL